MGRIRRLHSPHVLQWVFVGRRARIQQHLLGRDDATAANALNSSCWGGDVTASAMARFFKQDEIDEFRECFLLYARKRQVTTVDELAMIMRSLRLSPTSVELRRYLKQKGGQLSFPDFLEVMHEHTERERVPEDIVRAFQQQDTRRTGNVTVKELRWLLAAWGDRLSKQEVDQAFREAKVPSSGTVKYEDFIKIMCAPLPDYN